ncbi:putative membrane protein YeiB [Brevibacterium sanguinis]|uniref:Membrane protein YeiB n=2 Tax=Brevibacterium TaxID=1696 RepID=A0ABX9GP38_9MICO|nr:MULTISPECIES: DUF418 domain-containing protein [Brevibacterium]RBP61505.1 putative membrane protein YeiB [Brevibacterium sanguinis]RBP68599.1 putative membrane protein YeiB [Brevibacterium celere]
MRHSPDDRTPPLPGRIPPLPDHRPAVPTTGPPESAPVPGPPGFAPAPGQPGPTADTDALSPGFTPAPVPPLATNALPAPPRALAPDLARGFMLCLIAIANVSVYLWGSVDPTSSSPHPTDGSTLDTVLSVLTILFVDGRIYPMFAFLFGYGMIQFSRSRTARGDEPAAVSRMLVRRNLWLIVFGFVHALLLFGGDILGAYGLAGLVLGFAVLRGSDRALRITAWILAGLVAAFSLVQFLFALLIAWAAGDTSAPGDEEVPEVDPLWDFTISLSTLGNGEDNYLLALAVRIGMWFVSSLFANLALAVPLCILLGALAARHLWIEAGPTRPRPSLGLVAELGIAIGVLGAVPQALQFLGLIPEEALAPFAFMGLSQLTGIAAGLGYVALFGIIGTRLTQRPPAFLLPVAHVGKRSLSFYLLQSLVFAPLLAAWGFGLGETWTTTSAYLLALGIWIVSLPLAWAMERTAYRGPAEVVLRRLTYGRRV